MAREAAEFYRPLAEQRRIVLAGPSDGMDERIVSGDPALLFEVAANMLDNAVKFTPDGGRVAITVTDGAPGPVLTVQDNGPGIPEAERALVLKTLSSRRPQPACAR